jgi:cell division transport system permease protein
LRAKFASLLIILTTAIAIVFVSASIGLVVFSKTINEKLKDNIKINLFVSDILTETETKALADKLFKNVYVSSYKFISKQEALDNMRKKTGEDFLSVLEKNPLPASYSVKLKSDSISTENIVAIVKSLTSIKGISDVAYDYSLTLKILNYINRSKKIIYLVSAFLVLLSIYLVYSNNRLMLSARMKQYNTMKLVGAKLSTIKIPILMNGMLMGFFASGLCLGSYFAFISIMEKIYVNLPLNNTNYYFIPFIILLGIFLGFLGSWFATFKVSLKINKK